METRWMYVTSENFEKVREVSKGVCVLPSGCIEMHANHLPLGTDVMEAEALCKAAAEIEPVCIAPAFYYGDVPEGWDSMPAGSFTITLETEMKLMEEILGQIARNGFKKILIVNCHGGNRHWQSALLRKLETVEHPFVTMVKENGTFTVEKLLAYIEKNGRDKVPEITDEELAILEAKKEKYHCDGHGGFAETALMMAAYPETVKMDRLGTIDGYSNHKADKYNAFGIRLKDSGWCINHPNCYHGEDPVDLNPRIASAILRLESEELAAAIRFLKEDDDCLRWHDEKWGSHLAD